MRTPKTKLIVLCITLLALGCSKDDGPSRNETSIIPPSFQDRDNENLGTITLESREITISIWDHGRIDGDIVSIFVNGKEVITERTLEGPANTFSINTTLEYDGYNYVLLYAHNEGSISPNTVSMSIDDGSNIKEFVLEANLLTNGAVDLVVN